MDEEYEDFSTLDEVTQQKVQDLKAGSLILIEKKTPADGSIAAPGACLSMGEDKVPELFYSGLDWHCVAELISDIYKENRLLSDHEDELRSVEFFEQEIEDMSKRMVDLTFAATQATSALFIVTSASQSESGDLIKLVPLIHSIYQAPEFVCDYPHFQIYDNLISYSAGTKMATPTGRLRLDHFHSHLVHFKITADIVRNKMFGGRCTGGCNDGWLPGIDFLPWRVRENLDKNCALDCGLKYKPVCPFCIGEFYTTNHMIMLEALRQRWRMATYMLGDFMKDLNAVRSSWGYSKYSFICTEWFEGLTVWRDWSKEKLHPALLVALSHFPSPSIDKLREPDSCCELCDEELQEDTFAVELPCGHVFCNRSQGDEEGCITRWFRKSNQCPKCRFQLSYGPPYTKRESSAVLRFFPIEPAT